MDRLPRIEHLAKQPQFDDWLRLENSKRVVNKSIGAIVSMIISSAKINDDLNANGGFDYSNFLPEHVSYGYFSCLYYLTLVLSSISKNTNY